jgi:hypothetical protein
MTQEEREVFYDREIAPALLDLARKCESNGLSLVAMTEWWPGETGLTATVREGAGIKLRMTQWAAAVNGNVDALIMQLQKHGREHGHNSLFLSVLERRNDT